MTAEEDGGSVSALKKSDGMLEEKKSPKQPPHWVVMLILGWIISAIPGPITFFSLIATGVIHVTGGHWVQAILLAIGMYALCIVTPALMACYFMKLSVHYFMGLFDHSQEQTRTSIGERILIWVFMMPVVWCLQLIGWMYIRGNMRTHERKGDDNAKVSE